MNFPLQDIEFFVADAILEQAEQLIELQAIRQFQEIDRNLWVALIEDGQTYEVEVQISPSKVKAFTCDCHRPKPSNICAHVSAILLLLRQKMNARKEKIQKAKEPKAKVPNRITTTTILDLVKPNELKAFIKKYASQDRTFTLMLKAQFAHIVPGHEEKEHISKVLEHTIKGVKRPGKLITISGAKLIQRVVNTLLQQSEEALYKKHYADVFESLNAIIAQLAPISNSLKDDATFSKLIKRAYHNLHQLSKCNIAPQLENEIWNFLINESIRAAYYLSDNWSDLLMLMLQMSHNSSRQEEFINILEELEKERFSQKNNIVRSGILNTKMSLLNLQGNQAALDFFLKYNMTDPEVLLSALKLSADKSDWSKVKQLANYGLKNQIVDTKNRQLHEYLLEAAIQKSEKKNILKYALICFPENYDFKYYDLLKTYSTNKKWLGIRNNLIQDLKEKPFSIENRNCIAKILADEKLNRELLSFIMETKSLDLLKKYDEPLRASFPVELQNSYKTLIYNYLNNYLGRQAAVKIRQSIEHLIAQDQAKLAKSLVLDIRSNYKERHSLLDELGKF